MGQFIDCENPYITCSNEFIETEWWIIKEMFKKDLIYYGNKVLWYCPRCGTELSANEVSQGYQEVSVNSLILPFKSSFHNNIRCFYFQTICKVSKDTLTKDY